MKLAATPVLMAILLVPLLALAETGKDDLKIVPGKSVGLIKPGMSAAEIGKLYGKEFKLAEIPGPEGSTFTGGKLFEGSDRELELIWQEGPEKKLADVNVVGTAWIFENGIKIGMTLTDVEKLNGKPFKMSGFDWDYGGYVTDFMGGALKKISVRFTYGNRAVDSSLVGDKAILSSDATMRKLNPVVEGPILVHMNLP